MSDNQKKNELKSDSQHKDSKKKLESQSGITDEIILPDIENFDFPDESELKEEKSVDFDFPQEDFVFEDAQDAFSNEEEALEKLELRNRNKRLNIIAIVVAVLVVMMIVVVAALLIRSFGGKNEETVVLEQTPPKDLYEATYSGEDLQTESEVLRTTKERKKETTEAISKKKMEKSAVVETKKQIVKATEVVPEKVTEEGGERVVESQMKNEAE